MTDRSQRTKPSVAVPVVRLPHGADLPLPGYQTDGAAGMDAVAAVPADAPLVIPPGGRALVPTGLAAAIPAGYEIQVRPRSGLAFKNGVTVLNAPGTVDEDYRGEICVLLVNFGDAPFVIERGMRIAQLMLAPVTRCAWLETDALDGTARGACGFGSTGTAR